MNTQDRIPRTFILEGRPAISSYKMENFEEEFEHFDDAWFNWSVWEWQDLVPGDEFFMIKCGEGVTGVVMHGFFDSEPYQGEDWSGKGREVYYADLDPDTMIHPDKSPLLTTEALEAEMPDFQWNGGHSGRVLPSEYAIKLRAMWQEYIAKNKDLFKDEGKAVRRVI